MEDREQFASHIIFEARIIAVADVVDAMLHRRVYKPGMSLDRVVEVLGSRGLAGKPLFDKRVVDGCLSVLVTFKLDLIAA